MPFFVAVPAAIAAATALFSAVGGMRLVVTGIGINEYQRRRGHKAGEGRLTQRENHKYYGVSIDLNSEHDISHELGILAGVFEEDFKPFIGKRFDMTTSEGQMLRAMLKPTMKAAKDLREVGKLLQAMPTEPEVQTMAAEAFKNARMSLRPVTMLLEQFPTKRVKSEVEKDNNSRRHTRLLDRVRRANEAALVRARRRQARTAG